jgi:hypothetical protein
MALYGTAASIPDRSIVSDITRLFLESMLYTDSSKPHHFLKSENGDMQQHYDDCYNLAFTGAALKIKDGVEKKKPNGIQN